MKTKGKWHQSEVSQVILFRQQYILSLFFWKIMYSFCYVLSRYKLVLLLRTAEPYREFFIVCKKIKLLESIFGEAYKTTVINGMNAVFEDYRNSWLFTNSRGELRSEIKVSRFESSYYLCAELSSVVIARLMSECLWSGWKW